MGAKGSFTYTPANTNIYGFNLPGGGQGRVDAINHNVARMYVTDQAGKKQPLAADGPY